MRRMCAGWLEHHDNKQEAANQYWIADALDGKLGNEIYTLKQLQGVLITGHALKKAYHQLTKNRYYTTVVIVSKNNPQYYNLCFSDCWHSEIEYYWKGHNDGGKFKPVKVIV